jgi:hypothetical protein
VLLGPWKGKDPFPADTAIYYGGDAPREVKPTPDSPLQQFGIDNVPPNITTGVLLDAKSRHGGGNTTQPGALVHVYTGRGDHRKDRDADRFRYTKGRAFRATPRSASRRRA